MRLCLGVSYKTKLSLLFLPPLSLLYSSAKETQENQSIIISASENNVNDEGKQLSIYRCIDMAANTQQYIHVTQ